MSIYGVCSRSVYKVESHVARMGMPDAGCRIGDGVWRGREGEKGVWIPINKSTLEVLFAIHYFHTHHSSVYLQLSPPSTTTTMVCTTVYIHACAYKSWRRIISQFRSTHLKQSLFPSPDSGSLAHSLGSASPAGGFRNRKKRRGTDRIFSEKGRG